MQFSAFGITCFIDRTSFNMASRYTTFDHDTNLSKIKPNLISTLRSLNLLETAIRCINLSFFARQKLLSICFIDFKLSVILNRD